MIGDKKGGKSTLRLGERPELLDRLAATVAVPVKIIQVVRNPYDNIATMHRRAPRASTGFGRGTDLHSGRKAVLSEFL